MKIFLSLALLFFLTGCVTNYVQWYPWEPDRINAYLKASGKHPGYRVVGWTEWGTKPCKIFASPSNYAAILAELRHCEEGHYHHTP